MHPANDGVLLLRLGVIRSSEPTSIAIPLRPTKPRKHANANPDISQHLDVTVLRLNIIQLNPVYFAAF